MDGSASRGVALVSDAGTLESAARAMTGSAAPESRWIAEEFLSGPEFSVETFSTDGSHHVVAVAEKFKGDNFVEIGHLVPARVRAADHAAMAAEVGALLDAVGLNEGVAHTEVVLTDADRGSSRPTAARAGTASSNSYAWPRVSTSSR
ncbi:hypothetical protein SBADM41S_03708 [Streptomyces badius]